MQTFDLEIRADVALLVNLTNIYDSFKHRFVISSPPFICDKPLCLKIDFASMAYFGVRLACVDENSTYFDRQLYRSSLSLGYKQSQMLLNIEQYNSRYKQCSLVLESESTQSIVSAIINDVQLLPAKCFSDKSMCTFLLFKS